MSLYGVLDENLRGLLQTPLPVARASHDRGALAAASVTFLAFAVKYTTPEIQLLCIAPFI